MPMSLSFNIPAWPWAFQLWSLMLPGSSIAALPPCGDAGVPPKARATTNTSIVLMKRLGMAGLLLLTEAGGGAPIGRGGGGGKGGNFVGGGAIKKKKKK